MRRRIIHKWTFFVAMLLFFVACQKVEDTPEKEKIRLQVLEEVLSATSRAYLFQPENMVMEEEFRLDAYYFDANNRSCSYFSNANIVYFEGNWRFREWVNGTSQLIDYYWPNDETNLHFLAVMPKDLSSSIVDAANLSFNSNGVLFSCTRPNVIKDSVEANVKEFVYAYTAAPDRGENVGLRFVHPFAAIKFRLHQSHRDLSIHSITLKNVYTTGTFCNRVDTRSEVPLLSAWTQTGSPGELKIEIEKTVPAEINFGAEIGGPYLVIPQSISGVKLQINYTWNTDVKKDSGELSIQIPGEHETWDPGKVYTYTLDLGDNKEEILFKVSVEPWVKGETGAYENEYDVE